MASRPVRTWRAVWMAGTALALVAATTVILPTSASARPTTLARASDATVACAAGTTVTTADGPVCGIVSGGVAQWLGIPYAAPPVGALRWQPPQPSAPWTTTLQATSFGSECVQQFPVPGFPTGGTENCLYLNVWAPQGAAAGANLPVLVHIHGGGFVFGNGNGDNSLLATTGNEVVVSMNYRLGIFGFLADSALGPNSGDYGLEDQQAALRWVQRNITAFGGDPHNVTIFGESAGASSACDQIASPTAAGLFERAVSTSGEYSTLLGAPTPLQAQDCKSTLPSQSQADAAGASFAAAVGCASAPDVAACMRAVPAQTAASASGFGYQDGGAGTVAPTINATILPLSLRQALAAGQVNRVSVIAGTDRDEDLFGTATTAAQYTQLVQTQYGKYASQVLALYPLSHFDSPTIAFRTVTADSDTVCPSLVTDHDLSQFMPVYAYEIDANDIPPYAAGAAGTAQGASHVGAWYLNPVTPALDANQQALQDEEVASVTHFAATGNPNANGTPPWPEFGSSGSEMVLMPAGDSAAMSIGQVMAIHNCGFWDSITPQPAQ
jgi:para-nitrobenzyl esterase